MPKISIVPFNVEVASLIHSTRAMVMRLGEGPSLGSSLSVSRGTVRCGSGVWRSSSQQTFRASSAPPLAILYPPQHSVYWMTNVRPGAHHTVRNRLVEVTELFVQDTGGYTAH